MIEKVTEKEMRDSVVKVKPLLGEYASLLERYGLQGFVSASQAKGMEGVVTLLKKQVGTPSANLREEFEGSMQILQDAHYCMREILKKSRSYFKSDEKEQLAKIDALQKIAEDLLSHTIGFIDKKGERIISL